MNDRVPPRRPPAAAAGFRRAFELHRAGRLDEAAVHYRAVLARTSDAPRALRFDATRLLGVLTAQQGDHEAAAALFRDAIRLDATSAPAHHGLGDALKDLGRLAEAVASYDRAVALRPADAAAHNDRAVALKRLGRIAEALAGYDRAIALQPDMAEAHYNRGIALLDLARDGEALAAFDRALALRDGNPDAHRGRGNALLRLGRPDDALDAFDRALALQPLHPDGLTGRGNALAALGRPDAALASYDAALAARPGLAEALANRGNVLIDLGRLDEAAASYRQAQAARPGHADAYWNEGVCRLMAGDFAGGWPLHEWRWKTALLAGDFRAFAQPLWRGDADLAGRTILLHAEQGLGDTLQFCRYVPLVARAGARVVLEVQAALAPLLAGLDGVAAIVRRGDALPDFDLHCPLLSLPLAFGTDAATVPAAVPYLAPPVERAAAWAGRLDGAPRPRIGIAWSGDPRHKNDRFRSTRAARFAPLLDAAGTVVSLQKSVPPIDEPFLAAHPAMRRFEAGLGDFADTAALVAQLDAVVAVDTSVVHLAGAMGKPVAVILPAIGLDWRWLRDRDDSTWYPTARLIRLDGPDGWDDAMRRAAAWAGGIFTA
ncbi:MAG: tetratricopeptide repeat protein [Rhodospirillales bacterium]